MSLTSLGVSGLERRTLLTRDDPPLGDRLLDFVIRLGQGEQEADCLGFGADGELVIVSAQAQESGRKRVEQSLGHEHPADVAPRDGTLWASGSDSVARVLTHSMLRTSISNTRHRPSMAIQTRSLSLSSVQEESDQHERCH